MPPASRREPFLTSDETKAMKITTYSQTGSIRQAAKQTARNRISHKLLVRPVQLRAWQVTADWDISAIMENATLYTMSTLLSLVPAALAAYRRDASRDALFWLATAVAVAGPVAWSAVLLAGTWRTGLSSALWITVAASMAIYAVLAIATREVWRLAPLLLPYLFLLGIVAAIWSQAPGRPMTGQSPIAWIEAHIVFSVLTYGILTVAAVAGVAVFLQERAMKGRRPTPLTALLPSVAAAEIMQVRLLLVTEVVLGLGLATGMALQYLETGTLVEFSHKTLLSIVAFLLISALLIVHYRTGMRGRRASRYVLIAYLMMTLGYPGVKFVTDVLIGQ